MRFTSFPPLTTEVKLQFFWNFGPLQEIGATLMLLLALTRSSQLRALPHRPVIKVARDLKL